MSNSARLADTLEEMITELVRENKPEIDADDVTGLDDAIQNKLDENKPEIDADDVTGLDDAIQNEIDRANFNFNQIRDLENASFGTEQIDGFYEAVQNKIDEFVASPAFEDLVKKKAQEAVIALLTKAMVPQEIPMAQEVEGYQS